MRSGGGGVLAYRKHAGAATKRVRLERIVRLAVRCVETNRSVHMRTNIVIDDALMRDALKATGAKTKREAVELGLRTLLRLRKQQQIKALRGRIPWQGDLDRMRLDQ